VSSSEGQAKPGFGFAIAAVICLAAGLLGGLIGFGSAESKPAPAWFSPPQVGAPEFRLRDHHGRLTSLRDVRGEVVVLTFLFSTCRQLCPAQAAEIAEAVVSVGTGVQVLGISVDPVGDTPENVRAFMVHNGLEGGPVRYLVGTRDELTPVWARYGIVPIAASPEEIRAAQAGFHAPVPADAVRGAHQAAEAYTKADGSADLYFEDGRPAQAPRSARDDYPSATDERYRGWPRHGGFVDFEHSAYVMLIDKHGRQRVGFPFERLDPDLLERDIRRLREEP
jgi:protein SCO1/2